MKSEIVGSEPVGSMTGTLDVAKLALMFDDLSEAVVVADVSRCIVWANAALADLLGYSLAEVAGKKTSILYEARDDYLAQGKNSFNHAGTPVQSNYRVNYRHKSGRVIRSETIGWPVRGEDGEVAGYAAIIRDVGEILNVHDVLTRLYEISSSQSLAGTEKIAEIMRMGCEHFRLPTAIVSIISGTRYSVLYSHSTVADIPEGTQFDLADTFCNDTVNADGPRGVPDAGKSNYVTHPCYTDMGLKAYFGIPLIVDGSRVGTLNFSSPVARSPFSEADYDLIKLFGAWVAQEIGLEQAYEELSQTAATDWLTEALTRRMFHLDIEQAFGEFQKAGQSAALVIFDIDHFKQVNDQFGHAAGDEVLRRVAETTRDELGTTVKLYRIGGEEFAIIFQDLDPNRVLAFADRLRLAIAAISVPSGQTPICVTASFGVAPLDHCIDSEEAWVELADGALFASKHGGRNQVRCSRVTNIVALES